MNTRELKLKEIIEESDQKGVFTLLSRCIKYGRSFFEVSGESYGFLFLCVNARNGLFIRAFTMDISRDSDGFTTMVADKNTPIYSFKIG